MQLIRPVLSHKHHYLLNLILTWLNLTSVKWTFSLESGGFNFSDKKARLVSCTFCRIVRIRLLSKQECEKPEPLSFYMQHIEYVNGPLEWDP